VKVLALTDAVGNCASYRARLLPFLPLLEREGIQVEVHRRMPSSVKGFDLVWLRRALLTEDAREFLKALPIVYDFDDATYIAARQIGRSLLPPHTVLAGSETLGLEAQRAGAKRVKVLRTGVQVEDYSVRKPSVPPVLVWTGSASTLGYLALIEEPLKRALKETGARLRVVCDHSPNWSLPTEHRPWSPEDQAPALAGAALGLAPLPDTRSAQGKCGFKIVQYMAAGLPVVASAVGANKELMSRGVQGVCVPTLESFYEAILTTLAEPWTGANRKLAESLDVAVLFRTLHQTFLEAV
jgi:glycosyltransferase involved in cell wall biosynthesis